MKKIVRNVFALLLALTFILCSLICPDIYMASVRHREPMPSL